MMAKVQELFILFIRVSTHFMYFMCFFVADVSQKQESCLFGQPSYSHYMETNQKETKENIRCNLSRNWH